MLKIRKMKRKGGQVRTLGPTLPETFSSVPLSPPVEAPELAVTPPPNTEEIAKPSWYLPPDSKVRFVALQAIAMRIAGMEDEDIAKAMGISAKSISPYIYRAGKNGWLDIDNPKQRMEYQLMHKVVNNIETMLDSPDLEMRERVTMETAKGTLFKAFGEQQVAAPAQTMVAIKIEMPAGPVQQMREDTTGGTPAYLDAEVKS